MPDEHDPWGRPPWRVELPAQGSPPPARCDVAVAGAGITGLAAARRLAASGRRVAVLEAGRVGAGASGRSGGLALEGSHLGELPGADRCLETLAASAPDCGLRLEGCAELVHRGPAAPDAVAGWRDAGRELAAAACVPGGVLDPGRLLAGLAREALTAGAGIHEGTSLVGVDREPAGGLRLETSRGPVRAGRAILALNAFGLRSLPLPQPPLPSLSFALRTEPLAAADLSELGLSAASAFYTQDLPYLWGRGCEDGGLILGSGLVTAPIHELERIGLRDERARRLLRELEERLRALHPVLGDVAVRERWCGPIALLRGRPPLLGWHPREPRLLVAGGYTGHGVAAALHFGEWSARALLGLAELPSWGALDAPAPAGA